ncbi:MAG: sugar phosphate isomerase/epimerase family protein [Candidatus Hydrogenedentota bacterium]
MEIDVCTEGRFSRRDFLKTASVAAVAASVTTEVSAAESSDFSFRYNLASSLYGELSLDAILPEVRKIGATEIDLWPRVHGNQREQIDEMGHDVFAEKLRAHDVRMGMITRYDLGPYGLQDEMKVVKALGGDLIIAGSGNVDGASLKERVGKFVESMKPHVAVAEELGVTIGIENHANQLIESSDSLKYLAEMSGSERLGIAVAPYHLPQDSDSLAQLIRDLGKGMVHFYAWEHGMGCHVKIPKVQEMKQLPGYGPLDFAPIVKALKETNYSGRTSIFMHPVPRGIPILPTAAEVTRALNRSREYLDEPLKTLE